MTFIDVSVGDRVVVQGMDTPALVQKVTDDKVLVALTAGYSTPVPREFIIDNLGPMDESVLGDFQIPDSLDGLVTARDYRKSAQQNFGKAHHFLHVAAAATGGRPNLSNQEKVELMDVCTEAIDTTIKALQDARQDITNARDLTTATEA